MNNFRIIAIAALLVLLIPATLIAQETEKDVLQGLSDSDILISQVTKAELCLPVGLTASEAYLKQIGDGNSAVLDQRGENVNIYVLQDAFFGEGNRVTISQNGSDMYAGVTQLGSSNTVSLSMDGDNIYAGIGQKGWRNNVDLDLIGDNMLFGIIQIGWKNNIEYETTSGNMIGLGFNDYLVPIKITQKGMGANLIIHGN